jgi:hypothetical protein
MHNTKESPAPGAPQITRDAARRRSSFAIAAKKTFAIAKKAFYMERPSPTPL